MHRDHPVHLSRRSNRRGRELLVRRPARSGRDTVPWYPHPNKAFHLPDGDAPLIFVGPGTGIAPFRGHLQELAAANSNRKVWLFYGHRNAATDGLYLDEFLAHQEAGVLTQLELAWSRDQDQKVYVQDRIKANAEPLWELLEQGGIVMVCGAAVGMAPGVRAAFVDIANAHGKDGEAWLQQAIGDNRYREDVY